VSGGILTHHGADQECASWGASLIIGIDLGTTNCACAIFRGDGVEMIPNSLGQTLTPSAVSVDDQGFVLTGLPARERQSTHADRTVTAFKRYMGSKKSFKLGKQSFTPEELSALMLRSLKADAETFLGGLIEGAIITVPAYFNDTQRKATRRAGELAGLNVKRLINEPTAAALAYGIHQRDAETKYLVFDLGGGTFDVSILELFEGVIEVRASAGDNRLGGEDFNNVLVEMAKRRFAGELGSKVKEDGELHQRLREAAERTRRALTDAQSAPFSVVWEQKSHSFEISTEAFEQASEGLVARMREPVLRSLRDSSISAEKLDQIILVGGATRMPLIRKAVTRMFGRFPSASVNPDEAVAYGAAVQAALMARDAALNEVVMTDVCPYSLGVDAAEGQTGGPHVTGVFVPIIERNTAIPASRESSFSTVADDQTRVAFGIYQGESRWVKDNIELGRIEIPVPRARAGQVRVDCRLSYDINGLLEVDVHVPMSGRRNQLVIVDKGALSGEELEARRSALAKLKVHPRDTDAVRATLARAGRCYENALGELRGQIGHLITQFELTLERQDPRACEAARLELGRILDSIEGQSFL
jgi:molecular chaperone HscC